MVAVGLTALTIVDLPMVGIATNLYAIPLASDARPYALWQGFEYWFVSPIIVALAPVLAYFIHGRRSDARVP